MENLDWIAVYAAIVGTGALALEIRRWVESGARLVLRVVPKGVLISPDAAPVEGVWITVVNRGNAPTTLTSVGLYEYEGLPLFRRRSQRAFALADLGTSRGMPGVPYMLEPGRSWTAFQKIEGEAGELLKSGRGWIAVGAVHSNKETMFHVKAHES